MSKRNENSAFVCANCGKERFISSYLKLKYIESEGKLYEKNSSSYL